jgi:hypothetical protein
MFEEILRSEPLEHARDEALGAAAEPAGALAVQRNADGDIVIRQHRPLAGHDPQIVVRRDEAATLVEAIRREMQAATE